MKIGIDATFLNEKPTGVGVFTKEILERLSRLHRETLTFTSADIDSEFAARLFLTGKAQFRLVPSQVRQ